MADIGKIDTGRLQDLGLLQTPAGPKKKELGQDAFLELMIAQMKNQDPLEPQSNGEFLTQMAQFGTVDGVQKLQQSFASLSAALQSNQALQASALVGRKVLVPSSQALYSQGDNVKGQVELPHAVSQLKVAVYNAQGEVVRHLDLGQAAAGNAGFSWDGKSDSGQALPDGRYTFRAEALVNGENKSFTTQIAANVDSVTLGNGDGDIQLNLAGAGSMPLSAVKQIQ